MNKITKIIFALAPLSLILMYLYPIWSISLEAPQYPEGLGMYINISSMEGHKPNDIHSVNGLNHYIGMKIIEPDSIVELKLMPYIILFMILTGLGIVFLNNRKLILVWIVLFLIVAVIGMYDFYMWGYDYGHNLDPHAIIKIPGMYYQPPLIGSKQLLNFTAHSYPYIGGFAAVFSIVISGFSFVFDKYILKNQRTKNE